MKTTKGGKVMNPTDAYRKELRKKELKRNKKERKKVREVGILKKDPEAIRDQIEKLERMKADGALDKARKHKKRQLEDTLNLVLKKRKEYEDKMREKGETPVMFSHLAPPRRRTAEEEERVRHPRPEDSVYYHPTLNPTGAPPPGKPPMYKSSIGSRISLNASSSAGASSSTSETDEGLPLPPPPPPPPLPSSDGLTAADDSDVPSSVTLPFPPPIPPKPIANLNPSLPMPPPPPKEPATIPASLPTPPPPPSRLLQPPPPPGTIVKEADKITESDKPILKDSNKVTTVLPPPPPPPGLPPKSAMQLSDAISSEFAPNSVPSSNDSSTSALVPPPPPRQPPGPPPIVHRIPLMNSLQPDMMPPVIPHFPPPDMRPPIVVPGIPSRPPPPPPPGIVPPPILRPMFVAPPGPPPFPRPFYQQGPPISQEDDHDALRPSAPQKPSYIKSAASTVVKRPLAQHNPELTAMVPASVRVRRETAAPKAKPKSQHPTAASLSKPPIPTSVGKPEAASTSGHKPQSIDDSYTAFLEDMKALGALDG